MRRWLRALDWRVPVALAATYIFFGSGPAATAAAIKTIPPFLMVGLRGLVAGTILATWAVKAGAPVSDAPPAACRRDHRRSYSIGTIKLTLGM